VSYDQKTVTERFTMPSGTYGATAAQVKIIGPKGKRGIVRDILFIPTADMVGTTTVPEITVGATAGSSEYARFRLGTSATAGYTSAQGPRRARSLVTGNGAAQTFEDFTGHVKLETADIPADTAVFLSGVAGVGGTPAGTFAAYVDIDWV
jgi:hypothetical protein